MNTSKPESEHTVKFSISLPPAVYARLRKAAYIEDATKSRIIQNAVTEYCDKRGVKTDVD